MKHVTWFMGLVAWIAMATAAGAQDYETILSKHAATPQMLETLMENGRLFLVKPTEKQGVSYIVAGVVIDRPIDRVYAVISGFADYYKFMPYCEEAKIIWQEGDRANVRIQEKFIFGKVKMLAWSTNYTLDLQMTPGTGMKWKLLKDPKVKNGIKAKWGGWELAAAGKDKTVAFYTEYADIKSISKVVEYAMEKDPDMDVAIRIANSMTVLDAVKNRCENPDYQPNLDDERKEDKK